MATGTCSYHHCRCCYSEVADPTTPSCREPEPLQCICRCSQESKPSDDVSFRAPRKGQKELYLDRYNVSPILCSRCCCCNSPKLLYWFVNTCTATNADSAALFHPARVHPARANPAIGREAPTSSESPSCTADADADAVQQLELKSSRFKLLMTSGRRSPELLKLPQSVPDDQRSLLFNAQLSVRSTCCCCRSETPSHSQMSLLQWAITRSVPLSMLMSDPMSHQ